ncbi:MAG TPA: helix-turn-helix domain-containing protein [Phycisphaerae bacterium]|nr:helix-turn-helix domain-containing protein [Phycisphaerae bacterium]
MVALNLPRLLTETETANALGMKTQTLRLWRSKNRVKLPYLKVGRSIKYRLDDIERFLETSRVVVTAE